MSRRPFIIWGARDLETYWKCVCGFHGNFYYDTTCRSCSDERVFFDDPDPKTLHRRDDPDTSRRAAETADITKRQKQFLDVMGMEGNRDWIADEIDRAAGFSGLWRRAGELEKKGQIYFTGRERLGQMGKMQRCFKLIRYRERNAA